MRRRLIFNLTFVLAVIALGAALWLTRQSRPPKPPARVSSVPSEAIRRIEIHHGNDLVIVKRAAAHKPWRLVAPVKAPADPAHVAALLKLASARPSHRYGHNAIAKATTGMTHPALSVRFNGEAPIQIGDPGPDPGSFYVQTAHALLLASDADLATLDFGWSHWIDPALVAPNTRLKKIVLPNFTLTRAANGHWQAAPAGQRSSADAAATVSAWQRAEALTVVPTDPSRRRVSRITLDFARQPPRHLDVIETHPNLVLRDPRLGVDYHLAGNRVGPLLELRHPAAIDNRGG